MQTLLIIMRIGFHWRCPYCCILDSNMCICWILMEKSLFWTINYTLSRSMAFSVRFWQHLLGITGRTSRRLAHSSPSTMVGLPLYWISAGVGWIFKRNTNHRLSTTWSGVIIVLAFQCWLTMRPHKPSSLPMKGIRSPCIPCMRVKNTMELR